MYMVNNIEFRNANNSFQAKLFSDIKRMKTNDNLLIQADKSRNIYLMSKDTYTKHLTENVTKTYKQCSRKKVKNINHNSKLIAQELSIDDRVEKILETEAYITIKDHKKGFPHKLSFRLLNPSKSDIGKISQNILDRINKLLITFTHANQWKNTSSVIDWFKNIPNKRQSNFMQFDVEDFYPSISLTLFNNVIQYSCEITEITNHDISIIKDSRKTLLFNNNQPWQKKSGDPDFDVPVGCYDGAEVCKLVGIYILNKLSNIIDIDSIRLYRDDGLGIFESLSGPQIERKKKNISKVFQMCGLSIIVTTNITSVDFLDVTFNLKTGSYQPFRKPNNEPKYIDISSNHPPQVLKHLPKSIEKRLSEISSSKEIFDNSKHLYEKALQESGFKEKLCYQQKDVNANSSRTKKNANAR